MAFASEIDIINRGLQHVGATRIASLTEDSTNASAATFIYDKAREYELRRNFWIFAIKRCVLRPIQTTTMLITPSAWDAAVSYPRGSIVSYGGALWYTESYASLNQTPGTEGWKAYFGPLVAFEYDSTESYYAGELVYVVNANGSLSLYVSASTGNEGNTPGAVADWDDATVYQQGNVVTESSLEYYSLQPSNLDHQPSLSPALWASGTTYAASDEVGGSDGFIYTSAQSANTAHQPVGDDGTWWVKGAPLMWTTVFTNYVAEWTEISASLSNLVITYPIGSGPAEQSITKNVFRLPNGWLREAPQNPKQGQYSYLGAPSERMAEDWLYEGHYLISSIPSPIVYRFVADVKYVPDMDPMFCEGLAAKLALDLAEPLTQSSSKKRDIGAMYVQYMGEARMVNAIDAGTIAPPLDDYIATRL